MKCPSPALIALCPVSLLACDLASKTKATGHSDESVENAAAEAPPELGSARPRSTAAAPASSAASDSVSEWTRCHHGFQNSGDPLRDILRLSLMCGPVTGMQAAGATFQGRVSSSSLATTLIPLNGECIRLVAAANGDVTDLEVELLSPEGASLGLVNVGQPWAVLPADRPVCLRKPGMYRVTLGTHGGAGEFALRVLHRWPGGDGSERAISPQNAAKP